MTGRKNKQPNNRRPRHNRRRPRYVSARGIQREKVDVSKLGRILEALMIAEAEAQAEAQDKAAKAPTSKIADAPPEDPDNDTGDSVVAGGNHG